MATFGWQPMPWQIDVLETAFEVDAFGQLWYRDITIVVPRQSGKTTLVLPWGVHRMIGWGERQRLVYIAQTASDGKEKLTVDFMPAFERSPLRRLLVPNRRGELAHLANGSVHLKWTNGSRWDVKPPTEKAGHGGTLHLAIGDEIFAVRDSRLEAALKPAQITVDDRQALWISTAGESKVKSPFLWSKVERGRSRAELVKLDPGELDRSRTMYVEFSAAEDADVNDPMTWWATMPALGFTQTIESVRSIFDDEEMSERERRRAFFCQWGEDIAADWKIPREEWETAEDLESEAGEQRVWILDVSPDRAWAAITLAAVRGDGLIHLEVIEEGPGTDWLIEGDPTRADGNGDKGIADLQREHGGMAYFDWVTVGQFAPDLRDADVDAEPIPAEDVAVAGPQLLDYVLNKRVKHIGQTTLTEQLASAVTKPAGDGGWKWARGKSLRPITGLVGVTFALRMLAKTLPDINHDPLAALRESAGTDKEA